MINVQNSFGTNDDIFINIVQWRLSPPFKVMCIINIHCNVHGC